MLNLWQDYADNDVTEISLVVILIAILLSYHWKI